MTCISNQFIVQRGNTVRLTAIFKDWDEEFIDPAIVKVIVYDRRWQKVFELELLSDNRVDIGSYFLDYVPEQTGTFYIEWQGRIESKPSLHRITMIVRDL
jgi:hypothetical protein